MSRRLSFLLFLSSLFIILIFSVFNRAILPAQAAAYQIDILAGEKGVREPGKGSIAPAAAGIVTKASSQPGVEQVKSSLDQAQTCTPDTPGMLSYWPLDDGPGATTFEDVIGGNDGGCVIGNCPASSAGKIDSALTFNGLDPDKVNAPANNPSLNWTGTDSFSFELWVKTTDLCTERKVFVGKYKDRNEGTSWASWWVGCGDNGMAVFSLRDSIQDTQEITGTVIINNGAWHHIVAGRDGTANENLLYVDGVEDESITHSYSGNFTSNNRFNIGYYNVSPYYYFSGQLDEVAIYDRILTTDEIEAHYNGGTGQSYCIGPPTALDNSYTVYEDSGPQPFDVLANDSVAPDSSGSPAIIAVGPGSAGGSITTDGSFVYYAPAANFFGTETFTYTINDGNEGNNATASVTVTVLPVNDPPTANDDSFTVEENSIDVPLDVLANDDIAPDTGETLTIVNLGAVSDGGGLATDGNMISYSPAAAFVGTETFTYTINDGTVASDDTATVTILVTPENKPPEVDNPGDQVDTEGDAVSLQIEASDPENADLTFDAAGLPSGLSIDPATGLVSGTISFNAASGSPYTVNVSALDNGVPALAGTTTFSWDITENSGPNVLDPGDQSNLVGDNVYLQIAASDADGDTLTYDANGLAPGLNIDPGTGLISGVLTANSPGNWTVEVIVSDGDADKDVSIEFVWDITTLVFLPLIIGN